MAVLAQVAFGPTRTVGIIERYRQRAAALLGNDNSNHGWYWQTMLEQRASGAHDLPTESSSGAQTPVTDETGGALEFDTTAGANRYTSKRGQQSIWGAAASTQRWYCVARQKITVIPTVADHLSFIGARAATLTTVLDDYFMVGFIGSVHHGLGGVDTKYALCLSDGTTVQIVRSTVTQDLSYHIYEAWFDGTLPYISVDGEAPIAGAATPVPDAATFPAFGIRNAAAVETHVMRQEWCGWSWRQI